MVQSVALYLKKNYDIILGGKQRNLLAAYGVYMGALADTHSEFACDCFWAARREINRFIEFSISHDQSKNIDETTYRRNTHLMAGRIVNQVAHVWDDHGQTHGDRMEISVKELIAEYFLQCAIPCDNPWDAIAACRLNNDLETIVREAISYSVCHVETTCQQRYETVDQPRVNAIFQSDDINPQLKDSTVQNAYDMLLRRIYNVPKVVPSERT